MLNLKETYKEASLGYRMEEEAYSSNMPNKTLFLMSFLLGLGIVLIGEAFFMLPLIAKINGDMNEVNNYVGFAALASKIIPSVVILIGFNRILKKDLFKTKSHLFYTILIVLLGFIMIIGITFLFNYLNTLIPGFEEAVNETGVNAILDGKSKIPYAICIVSFTPFVEEMVFRKLAFSTFKSMKLPRWATILIVAFIFALIHCLSEDPTTWMCYYNFIQYFLLSLMITLVYAFTNENLFASTSVHILNNAMALVLYFI